MLRVNEVAPQPVHSRGNPCGRPLGGCWVGARPICVRPDLMMPLVHYHLRSAGELAPLEYVGDCGAQASSFYDR